MCVCVCGATCMEVTLEFIKEVELSEGCMFRRWEKGMKTVLQSPFPSH